jgi:membrane protease subunit HflK
MPWNPGGGGGGDGPWGNGGGGGGGGGGPWGGRPGGSPGGSPGPDLDEFIRRGQDMLRRAMPGNGLGGGRALGVLALLALAAWGLTGIYKVSPDEQGV